MAKNKGAMGFYDRIKRLCDDRGIAITEAEMQMGIARAYCYNVQKRGAKPSAERVAQIADYFGVSKEYIMGIDIPTAQQPSTGVLIPLVGRVAAGLPITAVENIIGQEEITKKLAATGDYFALRIKGDSMSPDIHDGDIVVVRQQDDAENGDIVIAIINGSDGVCKEFRVNQAFIDLLPDNKKCPPDHC